MYCFGQPDELPGHHCWGTPQEHWAQFKLTAFSTLMNRSFPFRRSLISTPGHHPRIPGNHSQHECRHIPRNPTVTNSTDRRISSHIEDCLLIGIVQAIDFRYCVCWTVHEIDCWCCLWIGIGHTTDFGCYVYMRIASTFLVRMSINWKCPYYWLVDWQ